MHEFGHLQTLPLSGLHLLLLAWLGRRQLASQGRLKWLAALVIAHQASWELFSEAYVVVHEGPRTKLCIDDRPIGSRRSSGSSWAVWQPASADGRWGQTEGQVEEQVIARGDSRSASGCHLNEMRNFYLHRYAEEV